MQISPDLRYVCKRLNLRKMADLGAITENDLRKVFKKTSQIIPEIEELIQLARTNYVTPRLAGSLKAAGSPKLPTQKNPSDQPKTLLQGTETPLEPEFAIHDVIFIPMTDRGRSLGTVELSVRLRHILDAKNIRIFGDLNGLNYEEIKKYKNCGSRTIVELRELIRQLQLGTTNISPSPANSEPANFSIFVVPIMAREFLLSDLPISPRLENVLQQRGWKKLGEVDGVEINDLSGSKNCGRKTIQELQSLIRRASTGEFSPTISSDISSVLRQITDSIESNLARFPQRNRKILEARISGNKGAPRTLEDIAQEFKMTRERVRQIVKTSIQKIRRNGGLKLTGALLALTRECELRVCPLTADLFAKWVSKTPTSNPHDSMFYVRVLDTLEPSVPAWPIGSTREGGDDPQSPEIQTALENWLRQAGHHPTAAEAYTYLRQKPELESLKVAPFLAAIRIARKLIIDFPEPDRPQLRLRRLHFYEFAHPVLDNSSEPLTPEEIVERAKARFGEKAIVSPSRGVFNNATPQKDIFLLGPRLLGVRKHFKSHNQNWPAFRNIYADMLRKEKRPISTTEAVAMPKMAEFNISNHYEMAVILREDKRFVDLGRLLFGLTSWGIQEREFIKDLLPRVLKETNRVMTVEQILEKITRLRSVSPNSIVNYLKIHPEVQSLGFGYYGLKNWGNNERNVILADRGTVERAVRRAPKPVSFQTLCRIFTIDVTGEQADLLWKSCAGSAKIRRAPDQQSPETLLLHKFVSLEQSLADVSRTLQRPAPAYELQWELSAKYGEIFASISLKEVEERLEQSEWFLRDSAGKFFLDEDFNNEDFDPDAIREAATKSLADSMDIVGCDELIERLDLLGFELDDLSEDMLASILRGAAGLSTSANRRWSNSPRRSPQQYNNIHASRMVGRRKEFCQPTFNVVVLHNIRATSVFVSRKGA